MTGSGVCVWRGGGGWALSCLSGFLDKPSYEGSRGQEDGDLL